MLDLWRLDKGNIVRLHASVHAGQHGCQKVGECCLVGIQDHHNVAICDVAPLRPNLPQHIVHIAALFVQTIELSLPGWRCWYPVQRKEIVILSLGKARE